MNDEGLMRMIDAAHRPLLAWAIKNPPHAKRLAEVFVADLTRHTGGERQRIIPAPSMVDAVESFTSAVGALVGLNQVATVRLRERAYDKLASEVARICNASAVASILRAQVNWVEACGVRFENAERGAS